MLVVAGLGIYVGSVAASAKLDEGKLLNRNRGIKMVGQNGEDISGYGGYVEYDQLPQDLVNAFVAVEDKRFWDHHGVDYKRIVGATISNLKSRNLGQGASTITCQLVKNTHLDQSKTLSRKIKEAKLAKQVERKFSKKEIMEMYLNVIYFGSGLYGVNAASHGFFDKAPNELTLAECASIAATVVNPQRYSPKLNIDNNLTRRNMVLDLMQRQGMIDSTLCDQAKSQTLYLAQEPNDPFYRYRSAALSEAVALTGIDAIHLIGKGYTVYTYCDPKEQAKAHRLLSQDLLSPSLDGSSPDCMVLNATSRGHVTAYESTFALSPWSINRQPGSLIKPFIYAGAIERDLLLPMTPLLDQPTDFAGYTPSNYHDQYLGLISAETALAKSSNVGAVKVLSYVGIDNAISDLNKLGMATTPEDKHLALALGGMYQGVGFADIAGAYATLSNGGERVNATMIRKVTDSQGYVVYQNEGTTQQVFSPDTAYLVSSMLMTTIKEGTATKLGTLEGDYCAKTGTVKLGDGNSDAWCVAYDADKVTLSWIGDLSMEPTSAVATSGGGEPAILAREMLKNKHFIPLSRPDSVILYPYDGYDWLERQTLSLASPNTPDRYVEHTLGKASAPPPVSTYFTTPPSVSADVQVNADEFSLNIECQEHCSYILSYDLGFWTVQLDEIKQDAPHRRYPLTSGQYLITPVLHGKEDVEGTPYRFWIY